MAKGSSMKTKPAAFGGKGSTPKQVVVNPKKPAAQQKFNMDMHSTAMSGSKPQKAQTIQVDPKNRNKQQLDNIKKLGAARYGQGDNPFRGPKAK